MTTRITVSEATRVQRLEPVTGRVRVVVDTDAANEIDDQFALAYAILSPERLAVEAVYAAPFQRPAPGVQDTCLLGSSVSPAEGIAQSHAEIMRVLEALDAQDLVGSVHLGAEEWLPDAETPVPNSAADDLIARTRQAQPDADPIYVLALGAPTNVASALLAAPDIAEHVVVVWLGRKTAAGGHRERNTTQLKTSMPRVCSWVREFRLSMCPVIRSPRS